MSKSKKGNPNGKKAVKAVSDIKPQAPVDTKDLAVIEPPVHTVARTPINLEWIEFENNLITTDLIETVKEHTEIIHTLLTSRRKLDLQIASELAMLRNQFLAYATKNSLGKTEADEAFGEYVQAVFNIKASRAAEYIKVAQKKVLHDLKLSISSLCELARLNDEALKQFLIDYPPEEIGNMGFREVQILVKDNNENSVTRKTTKSSGGGGGSGSYSKAPAPTVAASIPPSSTTHSSTVIDIEDTAEVITGEVEPATITTDPVELTEQDRLIAAMNLKVAFGELKAAIDKLGLDKVTTDLFTEISQYFESAQKKGGV